MEKIVTNKEQLKDAIKNKEKAIIIDDEELAKKVLNFKKIKGLTKWSLVGLTAATVTGLALAPFTGGYSAVAFPAGAYSLVAGGTTISTAALATIGGLLVLGSATLYSIYNGYDVELDVKKRTVVMRKK